MPSHPEIHADVLSVSKLCLDILCDLDYITKQDLTPQKERLIYNAARASLIRGQILVEVILVQ